MTKLLFIIIINLSSFLLMGWDKHCAIKGNWRKSEKNLLGLSLLGGSLGTLLGMIIFHHKTKKSHFKILIPIFLVINIYLFFR